jgi:hypothetical protein
MNLHGRRMYVSATAERGVVGSDTHLLFRQRGSRVFARYGGGAVTRGCLIGRLAGNRLTFRYLQRETSGELHGGRSVCDVLETAAGTIRIVEHFTWTTREGGGTNVFDELIDEGLTKDRKNTAL